MKNFFKNMFNWMNDTLGSLRKDLIIHAGVSAVILVLLFNILALILSPLSAMLWGVFITLMIGTVKEYLIDDILRDSTASVQDLYADMVGVIIGVIVSIPAMFY